MGRLDSLEEAQFYSLDNLVEVGESYSSVGLWKLRA